MIENIKNLITGRQQKTKGKIKKDTTIINIMNTLIEDYKNKNNRYPLTLKEVKTIKTQENTILEPFYNDFEDEFEILILEIFSDNLKNNIEIFLKENNRYPYEFEQLNTKIKNTLEFLGIKDNTFKLIILDYIQTSIIKAPKTNKMRTAFKETFEKNEELFSKFIYINLEKKSKYKDFEEIGGEVKKILEEVEDQVLKHMEGGIHGDKSSSVSDKFKNFVNTIFPLYYNIGVKTRKLSPEEMKKYIEEMAKK